jgi:hypothetical protein
MGQYLDILKRQTGDQSDISDKSPSRGGDDARLGRFSRIGRNPKRFCQAAFDALERRCPDHIAHDRWRQAIADGAHFLAHWGERAGPLEIYSAWPKFLTSQDQGISGCPDTTRLV